MLKLKKRWRVVLILLPTIVVGGWLYHRWTYPYGWSHSCDKQLMFALLQYAEEHNGEFPAGEATPEASLSLLYPKYANEWVLQGRTVPLEVVKAILERGDRLSPDSCGWHYVDGLRLDDDSRLALWWDKVGLGHNGQRRSDGGHTVYYINLQNEYIKASKWEGFLQEQERLIKERNEKNANQVAK